VIRRAAVVPIAAAALGLLGSLAATAFLHASAARALDQVLDERLRGAGEAAAGLLQGTSPSAAQLHRLMQANQLEGAFLLDRDLKVLADATGPAGRRVDLLRVDPARVRGAFEGESGIGAGFALGEQGVATGYFPIRGPDGTVRAVLALEAGQAFAGARRGLRSALALGASLAAAGALALALVAWRWTQAERARTQAAERAARGEAMSRMAAMAAHEIRNPLAVIRGTIDLLRERSGPALGERGSSDLHDVLGEVERLRRLTEDFLDVAGDRAMVRSPLDLRDVLEDAARAAEASFPAVRVRRSFGELPRIDGDGSRLRQVFANLLSNAAQAQREGEIELTVGAVDGEVCITVHDSGPGVPPEIRARLFEPFVSGKPGGTGLGLALSRRFVERHGGMLELIGDGRPGATFQVRLPAAS
jgi:two-component system, OmpR family, sensor kinase